MTGVRIPEDIPQEYIDRIAPMYEGVDLDRIVKSVERPVEPGSPVLTLLPERRPLYSVTKATRPPRLHVAVDLDDVVIEFFKGVIASMKLEFDVEIRYEDCTDWDTNPVKTFPWRMHGYKSWWAWMQQREWLWAGFNAVPGSIGGIATLRDRGHWVEALTSKPAWAEHNVWKWLGKYRPGFNQVTVVDPDAEKVSVTDADLIIDDKPQNVDGFVRDGRTGVLFNRPWNQTSPLSAAMATTPGTLLVAKTWGQVLEIVTLEEEGMFA